MFQFPDMEKMFRDACRWGCGLSIVILIVGILIGRYLLR